MFAAAGDTGLPVCLLACSRFFLPPW